MIPFEHGQRLFDAAKEPKRFVEMAGSHNAGGLDVDPGYQRVFMDFLTKTPSSTPSDAGDRRSP
jgi:hypothetical protein